MRLLRGAEKLGASFVQLGGSGASDEHLALINGLTDKEGHPLTLKPLTADEVFVRGIRLCNDLPFKDGRRRITRAGLKQIVDRLPGVPVMINHAIYPGDPRILPVGRTFAGRLTKEDGVTWAEALFYTLRDHPLIDTTALVGAVDGGLVTQASIGMYALSYSCSVCGEQVGMDHEHAPGATYDKVVCFFEYEDIDEVEEWSMLASGMIRGTHYIAAGSEPREAESPDALDESALALSRASVRPDSPIGDYFEQPTTDPWADFKRTA
jgi:hypothetical protein